MAPDWARRNTARVEPSPRFLYELTVEVFKYHKTQMYENLATGPEERVFMPKRLVTFLVYLRDL